jgi:hypothetical protein
VTRALPPVHCPLAFPVRRLKSVDFPTLGRPIKARRKGRVVAATDGGVLLLLLLEVEWARWWGRGRVVEEREGRRGGRLRCVIDPRRQIKDREDRRVASMAATALLLSCACEWLCCDRVGLSGWLYVLSYLLALRLLALSLKESFQHALHRVRRQFHLRSH